MTEVCAEPCYIVERRKISHNIARLRQRVGDGRIYAVLKAYGYGLGYETLATLCAREGIRCFAVSDLAGAEAVCGAGIGWDELLLMRSAFSWEIPRLAELGVTFTVASAEDARALVPYGAKVHVKVDTGMGRRGFSHTDPRKILDLYEQFPELQFTGIYTHFSEGVNADRTRREFARFQTVLAALERAGIAPGTRHCCASSSAFRYDDMVLDGIRVGSALLGRTPGAERAGLQRTGVCRVPIEALRQLPKGTKVSYGGIFTTRRETTVAICPLGTHQGLGLYPRAGCQDLTDLVLITARTFLHALKGDEVLCGRVHGRDCKVLGRICSEAVMLDVTGVPCQPGDGVEFEINPVFLHNLPVVLTDE